jgi:hypothetical protein
MRRSFILLAILASIESTLGALYDDMASLPADKVYDYIIVGGEHVFNLTF